MNEIVNIISSSSKGNAYIYNKDILVDVGVSFAKIKEYLYDIKLILLTHRHNDHINQKTLSKIIYENPTVKIGCGKWLVKLLMDLGVPLKNIYVLDLNKTYNFGKYIINMGDWVHTGNNNSKEIQLCMQSDLHESLSLNCF